MLAEQIPSLEKPEVKGSAATANMPVQRHANARAVAARGSWGTVRAGPMRSASVPQRPPFRPRTRPGGSAARERGCGSPLQGHTMVASTATCNLYVAPVVHRDVQDYLGQVDVRRPRERQGPGARASVPRCVERLTTWALPRASWKSGGSWRSRATRNRSSGRDGGEDFCQGKQLKIRCGG